MKRTSFALSTLLILFAGGVVGETTGESESIQDDILYKFTFTHLYFSKKKKGEDRALNSLKLIKDKNILPDDGDPFLVGKNFNNKTPKQIDRDFGKGFAKNLFNLKKGSWEGPFKSIYGFHLIKVSQVSKVKDPDSIGNYLPFKYYLSGHKLPSFADLVCIYNDQHDDPVELHLSFDEDPNIIWMRKVGAHDEWWLFPKTGATIFVNSEEPFWEDLLFTSSSGVINLSRYAASTPKAKRSEAFREEVISISLYTSSLSYTLTWPPVYEKSMGKCEYTSTPKNKEREEVPRLDSKT